MPNPLEFKDLFGVSHTEPSVTGLIELQATEVVRPTAVNDLIIVSPFRSGKPNTLKRFRQMSALRSYHDPYNSGDQGVALASVTRAPFADDGMFGSADILTIRPGGGVSNPSGGPKQSSIEVTGNSGATKLFAIKTGDYGFQTLKSKALLKVFTSTAPHTVVLTLADDFRSFRSPALGPLFQVLCTKSASTATLTILLDTGSFKYLGQASDGDQVIINGVILEFNNDDIVSPNAVPVPIVGSANGTFDNFVAAVNSNVPGVTATIDHNLSVVYVSGPEVGINIPTGNTGVPGNRDERVLYGKAARLQTKIDSVIDVDLALQSGAFPTIDSVLKTFNANINYSAKIASADVNKFLPSNEIDLQTNIDILGGFKFITGYVSAVIDWVNKKTKGSYLVDVGDNDGTYDPITQTGAVFGTEPDIVSTDASNTGAAVTMTGGITPAMLISDIEDALDVTAAQLERGGILLVDTDDPTVMSFVSEFIAEQRSNGKWFRAFFGATPGLTPEDYIALAGSLDNSRIRLVCQRPGVFTENETKLSFLDPIFLAAALAGGAAGNLPFKNPLTNKRLRFAALHPDDNFDIVTRESLLEGGVTVIKKEFDILVVSLAVTTSRDPVRRMPRIMSEVDTVDQIDADMREAFLPFRGKWANLSVESLIFTVGNAVLNFYSDPKQGALVGGEDQSGKPVPPWSWQDPPFTLFAGVLTLDYAINIGGELDHVSEHGVAEYTRLVGTLAQSGGAQTLQTVVQ